MISNKEIDNKFNMIGRLLADIQFEVKALRIEQKQLKKIIEKGE